MGVIRNLPNLRQELNVDSQASETRMFKYLGALITGKNAITEEIKVRIAADNQCCYGLKHIFKSRTVGKISRIKIYETMLKPVVM
jgi:stalled ribosome rescue protein Dom34